ncbi:YcdB/YcdC domain-containing protein [Bacillus sp. AK031]
MLLCELKEKAIHIGEITSEFELEIEDYNEETQTAVFSWKLRDEDTIGVWLELTADGMLRSLARDGCLSSKQPVLEPEELKSRALSFAKENMPDQIESFRLIEWRALRNGKYRMEYTQYHLEMPLPFTGFYLDILISGEVTGYRYYGLAKDVHEPVKFIDKAEIKAEFLKGLKLQLIIADLSRDLYLNGDGLPHLVYEPNWTIFFNPETGELELREEEEEPAQLQSLNPPHTDDKTLHQLLGFDENQFEKIRETDMGDTMGIVWRRRGYEGEVTESKTFDDYLHKRNDETLKMTVDKETNKLKGFFSFVEEKGPHQLSHDECRDIATQLLFKLFPDARHYFKLALEEHDGESGRYHFNYHLFLNDLPVHFGFAGIGVNRTTGLISHFSSPDLDLQELNRVPSIAEISEGEAMKKIVRELEIEVKWVKQSEENQESYYTITYNPAFPRLNGALSFVEAVTGELIENAIK